MQLTVDKTIINYICFTPLWCSTQFNDTNYNIRKREFLGAAVSVISQTVRHQETSWKFFQAEVL